MTEQFLTNLGYEKILGDGYKYKVFDYSWYRKNFKNIKIFVLWNGNDGQIKEIIDNSWDHYSGDKLGYDNIYNWLLVSFLTLVDLPMNNNVLKSIIMYLEDKYKGE